MMGGGRSGSVLVLLLLALLLTNNAAATTTAAAAASSFTCKDGGKTLASTYFNDDYCDCLDGSDEPGTAACSLLRPADRSFACNRTADGLPQLLYPSRVGDGVCDCCDGSDEATGVCQDTCAAQAQQFVEAAQAEYEAVLEGWRARNEALRGVEATLAEWQAEIAAIEKTLAASASVLSKLQAYKSQEEKAEIWGRVAWLLGQTKGGPLSVEQEKEAEATSVSRIRVLHEEDEEEEDDRLDGVEKVLQGLVASEGGRSLSLQEYMEEQAQMARGTPAKAEAGVPSMGSVLAALEPSNVVKLNLQAMGALVVGPLKAIAWSFKVCLDEAYAAMGWSWDDTPARRLQFHQEEGEEAAGGEEAAPLLRWWRGSVAPTTLGWVVGSFLQGPDAAVALLRPDTVEGAPERLEAALLRSAVESVEEERGKLRARAQQLQAELASTGPGHVFLAWQQDRCFDAVEGEHTYAVCPFKDVKQGGFVLVGRWAGWGRRRPGADSGETVLLNRPEDVGRSMFFNEGQQCWRGPKRSVAVALVCGAQERVTAVTEPSVCVYDMVLETPLLCDDAFLAQAEARLAALGVETPQAEEA